MSIRLCLRAACALLLASLAGSAAAVYPERPIKVFLPFPPGGAVDFVSRLVCAEATEILGKPVVITGRAPAARSPPTRLPGRSPTGTRS